MCVCVYIYLSIYIFYIWVCVQPLLYLSPFRHCLVIFAVLVCCVCCVGFQLVTAYYEQLFFSSPLIHFQVLNEKPSEHQRQLLSVIMKTYKAIESNMDEQNKKIAANLDLSERHSQIQESDTFKEFQKSLDLLVDQSPNSTATDMLLILDKYSNVLIDIISSKVSKRETLIE